jgi:hypothetical protein
VLFMSAFLIVLVEQVAATEQYRQIQADID